MGSRLLMAVSSIRCVRLAAFGSNVREVGTRSTRSRRVRRERPVINRGQTWAAAAGLVMGVALATPALAQKEGGVLRVFHRDSPASMSIIEEGSISAIMPMMGVFNNLVLFDQHVPQNRVQSIVPDLATSWTSNEEGTDLTFTLREGVKWHDGKPFTAADVKCTYDLLAGKAKEKLRLNYREGLVPQPRRDDHKWRPRGHLSPEAAAAG